MIISVTKPFLSMENNAKMRCLPVKFNSSAIQVSNVLFTNLDICFVKHFLDAFPFKPSQPGKIGASSNIKKSIGFGSSTMVGASISPSIVGIGSLLTPFGKPKIVSGYISLGTISMFIKGVFFLILVCPYYSMSNNVKRYLPFIPLRLVMRYTMPTYKWMKYVKCPIKIIHGTNR